MRNHYRIVCILLSLLVIIASSCGKKQSDETVQESRKETTEESSKASSETSEVYSDETEDSTEGESETMSEVSETECMTSEAVFLPEDVFFGKATVKEIAGINRNTLAHPESMLYDILSEGQWTGEKVREMIESYAFPNTDLLGGAAVQEAVRDQITANRNAEGIAPGEKTVVYAIVTETADVRSWPTTFTACRSTDANAFDYFQESAFSMAEGVIILHESLDREWAFVQGSNYFGWVRTSQLAFCSETDFRDYLCANQFLVSLVHREGDPLKRLGTILPYDRKDGSGVYLKIPERQADGSLAIAEKQVTYSEIGTEYSDGYLPFSADTLVRLAEGMVGTAYGWGDTNGHYDCSSTVGLLYRCFGLYLPRNTGILKYYGGNACDASNLTYEERQAVLEEHPGALAVIPGHVMMYVGTRFDGAGRVHDVIHNTTGWYEEAEGQMVLKPQGKVVRSSLEDMKSADGIDYIDRLTWIVW